MNFPEALLLAIRKLGITKDDLARSTGYSHQYISELLKGERRWDEEDLSKVCEALGFEIRLVTPVGEPQDSLYEGKRSGADGVINELMLENQSLKSQVQHLKCAVKSLAEVLY